MNEAQFQVVHSVTIPSSTPNPEYIFDIKSSYYEEKLLISASNNYLYLYNHDLQMIRSHPAHSDSITSIQFARTVPNIYYSASTDKIFALWDDRSQPVPQSKLTLAEEINAMAVNPLDNLLLINENNEILFYDLRMISSSQKKVKPLGRYSDVHTDMVTQIHFSPADPNIFISGAEDGLIGVYSLTAGAEEDAVLSILNTDCPVNKIGFFGANFEGVYAISTIETATLWHHPSAQRLSSFQTIREELHLDYLVDCTFDPFSSELLMYVGTHEGQSNFLHMEPNSYRAINTAPIHCHNTTIRCIRSPDMNLNRPLQTIFSGGEDGRLCKLMKTNQPISFTPTMQAIAPTLSNSDNSPQRVAEVGASRVKVTKKTRYSPY